MGRSAAAAALNSFFRGIFAFVATEVAVPLQVRSRCGRVWEHMVIASTGQESIGDGGLYTLWGGLTLISELLILLVRWKGGQWREKATLKEAQKTGQAEHV